MITINDNIQKTYYAIAAVYLATLLAVVAIWGYTPCNDSDGYIELARQSIAYGEPYPCWPTIYGKPFIWNIGQINLIALSLWTTGSIMPVVVLMCVMKAATALLVATTGRKLFGPYAGLAAIVLFVLYPNNWGQSTMILSEIPAITFAMAAVAMMVGEGSGTTKNNSNYGPFKDNKGLGHSKNVLKTVPWRAMVAGALLALANWFRSISLVFLVAFFLYYLIFTRRQIISRFVPLMVGYVAFIIIVGTSCWMRTGYFIYQGDTLWFNMAEATYETSVAPHYGSEMYPRGTARYIAGREHMTAIECSAIWRERSLEWLKDHKIDYLEKVPGRLMYMYVNDMDNLTAFISDKSKAENNYITLPYRHLLTEIGSLSGVQKLAVANLVYYLFLLAGFVVTTIVMLVKRMNIKQLFLPVFIVVGGSLAIVLAVHGETRFKEPFMPFIFIVVGAGLQHFYSWRKAGKECGK